MKRPSRYYAAEPLITNDECIILNKERDVVAARDFYRECGKEGARSLDPRLIDPIRSIRQVLDRPPYQPRNVQPLAHMYEDCDKERVAARVHPGGYTEIFPGDVQYYIDPTQAQAYDNPEYAQQKAVVPFVFQDPMGALKPQYDRVALFKDNRNLSDYTSDQDQMGFREDMIERLQRKMNQNDYQLFVGHFIQGK